MSQAIIETSLPFHSFSDMRMQAGLRNEDPWHAFLALQFSLLRSRTTLLSNRHYGPLRVQRPFYQQENDQCHCYILHPPGGVVGGDRLCIEITAGEATNVLLTTPGAGKFYRCPDKTGELISRIRIKKDARLDWLPQETLFFDDAHAKVNTEIYIEDNAAFVAWDIACLGRPAAGEVFRRGSIDQRFSIFNNDRRLFFDRTRIKDSLETLAGSWGWRHYTVNAILLANHIDEELYAQCQSMNSITPQYMLAVTKLNDVLVVRYLGDSAEQAKNLLMSFVEKIKHDRDNEVFVKPRIWQT